MTSKPVFISYSSKYTYAVTNLRQDLEHAEIPVWVDNLNLQPGTPDWANAIETSIPTCRAIIFAAAPEAKASKYVTHELAIAEHFQIPVIPFWIAGSDWLEVAPFGMAHTQFIDARSDYPAAFQQLLTLLTNQAVLDALPKALPQIPRPPTPERLVLALAGHSRSLNDAAWSRDGTRIATASDDKTACIWEAQTGRLLHILKGHTAFVAGVAWSPDGTRVATASYDKTACIWEAQTGRLLLTLKGHTRDVRSVVWSPDGSRVLTASLDTKAYIWDPS